MKGKHLVQALRTTFRSKSDAALCRSLGITQVTLYSWHNLRDVTPRSIAQQMHRLTKTCATGNDVVSELKREFKAKSLTQLGARFGKTLQAAQNWQHRKQFSSRQVARLARSAYEAASNQVQAKAIRPIVEFFPIDKCKSKQGKKHELFEIKEKGMTPHPHLRGLRDELDQCHGVYIFFDSRGQAIYAGKARQLHLWGELTNAFNRKRRDLQTIKRVNHPSRRQAYRTSDEQARQIRDHQVQLHELAHYFSAYEVPDGLIGNVESLLVRSFANNLLNKRMEKFGDHSRKKKRKHRQRKR